MTATLDQPRSRVATAPGREPPRFITQPVRHPISRFYLLPLVDVTSQWLCETRLCPLHVSLANGACGLLAALCLIAFPGWPQAAAALVLAAWACDRLDGALARRQGTTSTYGAWLDANLDELLDLVLQGAVAVAAARLTGLAAPQWLFVGFVAGKYLFAFGLWQERSTDVLVDDAQRDATAPRDSWRRWLYHLPANADIRVHLLIAALVASQVSPYWLVTELAFVAAYYNLRWAIRYRLVARRLREVR